MLKIPLIEEEKLIPLIQCSLLVEHNFIVIVLTQKRLMQTVASIFVVEPSICFAVCAAFLLPGDATMSISL